MLSQINKQLDSILSDIRHQRRLFYILTMNERRLKMAKESLAKADRKTEKALRKYQKLEKHSAKSAIFNLIGQRNEKLEEEDRKYHSIKKRRDRIATKITDINQEIYALNQQMELLRPLRELENDLVKLKEDFLMVNDSEIFELTKKIAECKIDIKELHEAWRRMFLYEKNLETLIEDLALSFTWRALEKVAKVAISLRKRSKSVEAEIFDVTERMEIKLDIDPTKMDKLWKWVIKKLKGYYTYNESRKGPLKLLRKHRSGLQKTMDTFKKAIRQKELEIEFIKEKRQELMGER